MFSNLLFAKGEEPLPLRDLTSTQGGTSINIYASCSENSGKWGQSTACLACLDGCLSPPGVQCLNPPKSQKATPSEEQFLHEGSTSSEGSEE